MVGADMVNTKNTTEDIPQVKSQLVWALICFAAIVAARVLVVIPAGWMDESNRYLLVRPVEFASNATLLVAGFLLTRRLLFPRTFGKDSGTVFDKAWEDLKGQDRPLAILGLYMVSTGILMVVLALLLSSAA